jgi:hypothetical protein
MKPLMGIKVEDQAVTYKINMGKEKENGMRSRFFYLHKFFQALADLWSSEFGACAPLAEEMMSYTHAWELAYTQLSVKEIEGILQVICLSKLFMSMPMHEKLAFCI